MRIRELHLHGTPWEMGYAHGAAHRDAIRRFAAERIALAGDAHWSGRPMDEREVLELAARCLPAHQQYSPRLFDELRGISAATGLGLPELIIVGGFTDFIDTVAAAGAATPTAALASGAADNCTAMLIPANRAAEGEALLAQTWDMHATATEHVILLRARPADAPAFVAFTTVGCVGMIGLNDAGIGVGINNLSGADGGTGVTWPFVVREILAQTSFDDALAALERAPLAGAHNYLLVSADGRGVNIEATATRRQVTPLQDSPIVHTNHCLAPATASLERPRDADAQQHSEARMERAQQLLGGKAITIADLEAITRDEPLICTTAEPPRYVETCGAVIMRPASREFLAVWGKPSEGSYQRFPVA